MDTNDFSNNQNQNLITEQNQFPSQEEIQNSTNQTPAYNLPPENYNPPEPALPPAAPPVQYQPPIPNQNPPSIYDHPLNQPPQTIYQQLNIPSPIDNNINPLPQNNINSYTSSNGIYNYQSNIPPIITKPVEQDIPPEVIQGQNVNIPPVIVPTASLLRHHF